jgi:hypothetical protein
LGEDLNEENIIRKFKKEKKKKREKLRKKDIVKRK